MPGPETCIRFGEHGARVMIEDKHIAHHAIHVDPTKKEITCWIASEQNKVRESLFDIDIFKLFIPTNLEVLGGMART
jgi:hypothetical protein